MLHGNLQPASKRKTVFYLVVQIQFLKHFSDLFLFLNKYLEERFLFTPEHFKTTSEPRERCLSSPLWVEVGDFKSLRIVVHLKLPMFGQFYSSY